MGGWAKAGWFVLVVVLPLLGVLIYVLARGDSMQQRDIDRAQAQQDQFDAYVRQAAGTSGVSTADELSKLSDLKERGVISDEEFASSKSKLLN
jgi:hypothetical protein